jgi:iodotyrosine deiodinase
MPAEPKFVPLMFEEYAEDEMLRRSREFHAEMERRRSVRDFSDRPVAEEIVRNAIRTAGTAPSGAHKQPWTFVLVGDPEAKARIRRAAEAEEKESYERRMPKEWLDALAPLGTDWRKPFLTTCPWLIAVMAQTYTATPHGLAKHYYVQESVGIATGFLLAALHHAGLATLTHTPSPMGFLREILGRPGEERVFLLVAAGFPAPGCQVPALERKPLERIMVVR